MSALHEARSLAELGFPVIPLHTPRGGACDCNRPCGSPGKHPRTQHGLLDATREPEQIDRWWRQWPHANLGLVVPQRYVVLDFDVDGAGAVVAPRPLLGNTALAKTGRGWHFLYVTAREVRPAAGVLPHLDIRGPGSYIVAPPSLHANGATYTWIMHPSEGVAPAPEWLYELVAARAPVPPARSERTAGEGPIAEGARNATLTSMAGAMRRRGMSEAAILAALEAENAARCAPPLPARDLAAIARSVARYAPAPEPPASRRRYIEVQR